MARPKILVFQHVPYEPLGTLDPLLKEAGFRIRYVNFGREPESRPSLDGYEALIILGGPMNSHQIESHPNLITEVGLIREAVDRQLSVLGICLGAQLLAKALGGSVSRNETREIGWHDVELTEAGSSDAVLSGFGAVQQVFQWHEDGSQLPPGTVHLAASDASRVQAFRHGEHVYGLQFHLGVDQALSRRWLATPAMRQEIEALDGTVDAETILEETGRYISRSMRLSHAVFSTFISRFFGWRRRLALPSR